MNKTKLLIIVQIDAFRFSYINESMINLLESEEFSKHQLIGQIIPTFGFEPDGAYLSGKYPDECFGGAHFGYDPIHSPFKFTKYFPPVVDKMPTIISKLFRKALTWVIRKITIFRHEPTVKLPIRILPYVTPMQPYLPFEKKYKPQPNIFSICKEFNKEWLFHGAPLNKVDAEVGYNQLRNKLKRTTRLAFWHIGDLDRIGHKFGPDSIEIKQGISHIFQIINKLQSDLQHSYENIDWVIFGDHGMVKIDQIFNIKEILESANIQQGKGLFYFIDSTMVRFWFQDVELIRIVKSLLSENNSGRLLNQSEINHYHLNYSDNRMGELFFLANPGTLFLPNFFQGNQGIQGMHGYEPEYPGQQSGLILISSRLNYKKELEEPIDMRRIFPTILDLISIPYQLYTSEKSLIP